VPGYKKQTSSYQKQASLRRVCSYLTKNSFAIKSNWFQLTVTVNERELIHDTIFAESPAKSTPRREKIEDYC